MEEISVIGIDLAKRVFQLCAMTGSGTVAWEKRLRRGAVIEFLEQRRRAVWLGRRCAAARTTGRAWRRSGHRLPVSAFRGETQERSWSVLKPGGMLVSALGEPSREKAMQHRARDVGYRAQANAGQLAEIGRLIDQGKVHPVVMATYPLAKARQAHERLERGHTRGKIVLVATK